MILKTSLPGKNLKSVGNGTKTGTQKFCATNKIVVWGKLSSLGD